MTERTHYAGDGCQPAHQTPGPASPPAGPAPRVPASARTDAAGAGDPAIRLAAAIAELLRAAEQIIGELEDTRQELARVRAERNEISVQAARVPYLVAKADELAELRAALEAPGGAA